MSEIDDLEQDIEALTREIDTLTKKRTNLKYQLRRNEVANLATHPMVENYQSIFEHFPHLYDVLSKKNITEVRHRDDTQDSLSVKRKVDTASTTPRKRHSTNKHESGNPPLFQHKMFDDSIAKVIDTEILTSPSKRSQILKAKNSEKTIHDEIMLENVYRMFGITFFPVVDPSDLKVNSVTNETEVMREMIGVRLEVFNERRSMFEQPYYILLKKNPKSDSWVLFKHTIPSYIDIQSPLDGGKYGILLSYEDIYLFTKEIYVQLIRVSLRLQRLDELASLGVIEDLDVDLEAAAVSFSRGGATIKLLIQNDTIVSCSAGPGVKTDLEMFLLGPFQDLAAKLRHLND